MNIKKKQASKGSKRIIEENIATMKFYRNMSIGSTTFFLVKTYLFEQFTVLPVPANIRNQVNSVTDTHPSTTELEGHNINLFRSENNALNKSDQLEGHGIPVSVSSGKYNECICPSEVGHTDAAPVESPPHLQAFASTITRSTTVQPSGENLQGHLKIYYQNVRGLRTKIDELFVAASDVDHEVIILTETLLNDQINSLQLFCSRYSVYRNDRDPNSAGMKRGGGVLIAVSNRLSSKHKNDTHNLVNSPTMVNT
ncbi:uncharacterized protein LOC131683118 isoform X3 [Topomyia yanbarensis]|uniref:uncharacterized protein LOC131683118 isoform X3 n=1 Tax=Topomyia yanbarensis TaxID=2498891 RepID=UPI00273C993D|nr:uncharacterized protein LOC131683118 isoform X3 [Topomyia yanbarensis]